MLDFLQHVVLQETDLSVGSADAYIGLSNRILRKGFVKFATLQFCLCN